MQVDQYTELVDGVDAGEVKAAHLLVFDLAGHTYALPVDPVEQIVNMVAINPFPQEMLRVKGVITVRGAVVPVVDLGLALGLDPVQIGLYTPIILVQARGRTVGLIVDRVRDVISLPQERLLRPDDFLPADLNGIPLVDSVVRDSQGTILALDLDRLLEYEESGLPRLLEYMDHLEAQEGGQGHNPVAVAYQDLHADEHSDG